MNISKEEYEKEEKYLSKVKKIAEKKIKIINKKIDKEKSVIYEIKKYIWDECGSLNELEYGNLLNETDAKVNRTNSNIKKAINYEKILDNAYFGRVDFKTNEELYKVYIGINGLRKDENNYIYDWRAPICSLFYDNLIGSAYYEAPIGKIKGSIELRRQYKIQNGKIKRIVESEINIDDEVLQDVLSSNSSEKMKNIVTTIQREQNSVIRNTKDKYLIVQGVAGSGKTSVALHRIAYLLYKEKELNYNNVLIFSPNEIFSEYISNVLPELGEENVLNTTFNDLIKAYIKKDKKIENFSSFLERKYEKENEEKKIEDMKNKIDEFLKYFSEQKYFKRNISINQNVFNKYELNELLISKYKKLPFIEKINNIAEYISNKMNISFQKNKNKLQRKLLIELNVDLDPINIYNLFLEFIGEKRKVTNKVNYDDLEYIIYILFELNDYPYNTKVKHVIVDEAQDYSKLQFLILKRIFPYAYFTILGDINQTINPNIHYESLEEIGTIFAKKYRFINLNKTYRSSKDIIEYTNKILNINNVNPVRNNNGYEVIIRKNQKSISQIISDILILKENGMKKIALITKNTSETNKLYNKLKDKNLNISFVKNKVVKDSICILPSYISKGLEFDSVIVYNDINNSYTESEKKLFYVSCTRAQHQLIIYNN